MSKNVMKAFNSPKKDDGVRNVFDLSQRHIFSGKCGQLLPVCCVDTVPGDKFELGTVNITRTMPLNTPAFTRLKQSFDWVFVPYRALWTRFNEFIAQRNDPRSALFSEYSMSNQSLSPCYVPNIKVGKIYEILNAFDGELNWMGFDRKKEGMRLMDLLGYGDFIHRSYIQDTTVHVNLWRLLAYQKAFTQFYRDPVHAPISSAYGFNVDDVQGTSLADSDIYNARIGSGGTMYDKFVDMFKLHYRSWKKDLITGSVPSMQYGAVSAIPLSQDMVASVAIPSVPVSNNTYWKYNGEYHASSFVDLGQFASSSVAPSNSSSVKVDDVADPIVTNVQNVNTGSTFTKGDYAQYRTAHNHPSTSATFASGTSLFDILQLRKAEAIQKWKERTLRAGFHTDKQFEAHYGVSPDEDGRWCADFIGSFESYIGIDEVVTTANNNVVEGGSTANNNVGDLAGKGVGVHGSEDKLHFETNQFGVLMCIWSCWPEADYASYGLDQNNALIERFDYFTSEYENLGLQAIPCSVYNFYPGSTADVAGYGPRYWNYKTALDKVHGEFNYMRDGVNPGSLYDWATPRRDLTETDAPPANGFWQINPHILDSIFVVSADSNQDTDQFLVNVMCDIKAIRGMSVIGLPY